MKAVYWNIEQLPGLSLEYQKILQSRGIQTTQDLLTLTATFEHQKRLASQLKLPVNYIRKWVAMANLAQVPSVGYQYCGLLLHCGILSVSQLAITPLPTLQRQIQRLYVVTQQKRETRPSTGKIQIWLKEAHFLRNLS